MPTIPGLSNDEQAMFNRLSADLHRQRSELQRLDSYYDCVQALEQLGLAIPPELRQFVTIANWPRTVVNSIEERCDVEGFRLSGDPKVNDELWRIWEENDLHEESQMAHVDALVFGRSFACVGTNENDESTPLTTVESPLEMTCAFNTRRRDIEAALRIAAPKSLVGDGGQEATMYLPDRTIWLRRDGVGVGLWDVISVDDHDLGMVPVVMFANRSRTAIGGRFGRTEMQDVIGLTDACARALTNLQVAQETHAVPQRWALGVSRGDFVDAAGNPLPVWQSYFSAVWASEKDTSKLGQFSASDLRNFQTVVELYAHLVSGVTGLPVRYFGMNTANPPSADGIRADESRLVKTCERHNRARSTGWGRWARLNYRIRGESDEAVSALKRVETIWRNPATPTEAQTADRVTKLVQIGVLPREAAWEELGYSPERREQLKAMFAAQTDSDLLGSVAEAFRSPPVTADVDA